MRGSFERSCSISLSSATRTDKVHIIISVANNLRRQVRSRGGQRWLFKCIFPPLARSDFVTIFAFSVAQRGQFETFTWVPTTIGTTRGASSESPVVNGALAAGVSSAAIDGLTASTSNILRSGDFFKFSGHTKVYMIVAEFTPSSGAATVTIEPPLLSALADDEVVTYNNVPFQVHMTNDVQEFGAVGADKDGNLLYEFEIDVEEAI